MITSLSHELVPNESYSLLTAVTSDGTEMKYTVYQIQGQKYIVLQNCNPESDSQSEVFASNLPRDVKVDEIMMFFARSGDIAQIRMLMDFSGYSRGQCFVRYVSLRASREAICCLDRQCIRDVRIYVKMSLNNNKLIFKCIPVWLTEEALKKIFQNFIGDGLEEVTVTPSRVPYKNVCFCKYTDHYKAAMAHKKAWPYVTVQGALLEVQWAIPDLDKFAKHLFFTNFPRDMTNPEFFSALAGRINLKTFVQFRIRDHNGFITFSNFKAMTKAQRKLIIREQEIRFSRMPFREDGTDPLSTEFYEEHSISTGPPGSSPVPGASNSKENKREVRTKSKCRNPSNVPVDQPGDCYNSLNANAKTNARNQEVVSHSQQPRQQYQPRQHSQLVESPPPFRSGYNEINQPRLGFYDASAAIPQFYGTYLYPPRNSAGTNYYNRNPYDNSSGRYSEAVIRGIP